MGHLELKTYPDPCLKIRTRPVEDFTPEICETLKEMADIMYTTQGVGLAANQVGRGLKMLVMDAGDGLTNLINPEIVEFSKKKTKLEEGCLSLPGITVTIARPTQITVRAQNEMGEPFTKIFDDLAAKVIQHEIDHLNGKVIIDYLDPVRKFFAARTLKKNNNPKKNCEVVCNVRK